MAKVSVNIKSFHPFGACTGVGSLPHLDYASALEFVFRCSPEVPFVPQLPLVSPNHSMIAEPFLGFEEFLEINRERQVAIKSGSLERFLATLANRGSADFGLVSLFNGELFSRTNQDVQAIKTQLVGPITLLSSLYYEGGHLYGTSAQEAIADYLGNHATRMVDLLKVSSRPLLFFVDEPILGVRHALDSLALDVVRDMLSRFIGDLRQLGVMVGIHCCSDLMIAPLTGIDVDIISFDVATSAVGLERFFSDKRWQRFLSDGGIAALGVIPTNTSVVGIDSGQIADNILMAIDHSNLQRRQIAEQLMITSSCGLAGLSIEIAELSFAKAAEVGRRLRG